MGKVEIYFVKQINLLFQNNFFSKGAAWAKCQCRLLLRREFRFSKPCENQLKWRWWICVASEVDFMSILAAVSIRRCCRISTHLAVSSECLVCMCNVFSVLTINLQTAKF